MMNELYNQRILKLAADIAHIGALDAPQGTKFARADAVSRLCGSKVHVELSLAKDGTGQMVVGAFAHQLEACALGQASSSVMAREIIGTSPDELRQIGREMRAMLKDNGAPPTGRWADLEVLEPVRDFKNRHASTLLTFDAVEDCLNQLGV
jgi:NifU-like protein involved in Fe-S cluster formation